jgi:membrane fusion protein (multidrug efflux system)
MVVRRDTASGLLRLPADGQFQVHVKLGDGSTYDTVGALNFTDTRVNTQTGTTEARAEFPNKEGHLRAGEFVRVILDGAVRPNAIVLPQRAVLESPKGKFAYVLTADGKADARPLEVGEWAGDGWVILSGVKPGDKVITDGVMKLGPGAKVQVAPPQAAGKADAKANAKAGDKPGSVGSSVSKQDSK